MDKGHTIPILGSGYVRYIDHLGNDLRIVETARISYKSPSKGDDADKKLLFYLFKNRHTSPFESCNITFNIKMPIFCMRQFVRHRMFRLNEWSGRYSELADEFYMPPAWRIQDTKNKQGSLPSDNNPFWSEENDTIASDCFKFTYEAYQDLLERGVAKELARIVLPVALFTEIYVSCDIHNLINFLNLRQDQHAQLEMREIANAMETVFKDLFPWCAEARGRFRWKVEDLGLD